jgi:hypothetical protein
VTKNELFEIAKRFVIKNRAYPVISDLLSLGVTRDKVRALFGNITKLHDLLFEADLLLDLSRKTVKTTFKKSKRFVITTAVSGAKINLPFALALKSYCDIENAQLLILPSSDKQNQWLMDPILGSETFVTSDTKLNSNISILGIRNSAKSVDPISGLPRVGQRNGSFISASPKQRLKFVATGPSTLPHAVMSTGAITLPSYTNKGLLVSKTNYLAANDHVNGAIIVELDSDELFHFRQVQADEKGRFVDLGILYSSEGIEPMAPSTFVIGDYHSGETDRVAEKTWLKISEALDIKTWVMHDTFNSTSISHHDIGKYGTLSKKAENDELSLTKELDNYVDDLANILKTIDDIVIVKSNHDEHLDRYLNEARYVKDPQNHKLALKLASMYLEGENPLEFYSLTKGLDTSRVRWLATDENFSVANIQLGAHGDKGSNGSRGSMKTIEEAYGNSVTGHAHSPEILRGAWRVGTSSKLKLDYNLGPSSWFHTSCLVYPNGQRQLINCIEGRWTTKKIK